MAALTSAGVTVNATWKEGGTNGRRFLAKDVTLVLSSQGGVTNNVPAALFGMTKIDGARNFRNSSGIKVEAWPNYLGTLLSFAAAGSGTPADISATVRGIVVGH